MYCTVYYIVLYIILYVYYIVLYTRYLIIAHIPAGVNILISQIQLKMNYLKGL